MKTVIETESANIVEVRATWDEDEANKLLKEGWLFLHGSIAHKDSGGFQAKPCWLLGNKKAE